MIKLDYYTTSVIHLSLEGYHNAGLSKDETKAAIEAIVYPFQACGYSTGSKLWCEPSGINSNWNVRVLTTNPGEIAYVVDLIHERLNAALSASQ